LDIDDALKFAEDRTRDYYYHLVSVLGPRAARREARGEAPEAPAGDAAPHGRAVKVGPPRIEGASFVYGLISLAIGVTLQDLYVGGKNTAQIDFASRFASQICFWVLISLVLYIVVNVGRRTADYTTAMLVTLTVLPTAFVVGAYAAFVAHGLALFFNDPTDKSWPQGLAAVVDMVAQLALLIRCLPLALLHADIHHRARRAVTSIVVVTFVACIDIPTVYGLRYSTLQALGALIWHR
jgi:uncharacterized membrane protein